MDGASGSAIIKDLTGIKEFVNLKILACLSMELTSLDVSKNTTLYILSCHSNNIQTICVNSLSQPQTNWQKDPTATYKVCP